MKYYLDTEFHEYQRKPWFSKPFRTIELISIGIVAEDGREYYAISKDFDLKAAWCAEQDEHEDVYMAKHNYWLRENVLKPIFDELKLKIYLWNSFDFNYSNLKYLIKKFGKSNAQIAEEIKDFTLHKQVYFKDAVHAVDRITPGGVGISVCNDMGQTISYGDFRWVDPEFYAYYADYDWVVFCWLFGKMIDLPKGFPMYCRDLTQMLDECYMNQANKYPNTTRLEAWLKDCKSLPDYPKQSNEHNALADARWNKELHEFIEKL